MALTHEQRHALWQPDGSAHLGHRVVSARPGTGKTTTVTEYCVDLLRGWNNQYSRWQGMAVVSYTNVAKDELEQKMRRLGKANGLLSHPHFVGTIDAFLNQYLFLPFGAKFMAHAGARPRLVGEPYGQWHPWSFNQDREGDAYSAAYFDCYSFDVNGRPVQIRSGQTANVKQVYPVSASNSSRIASMKRNMWSLGNALQNDANYIAYALLKDSPSLTRTFIGRFPVFVIDEAQDMTEVQHALLDHLMAHGQQHIVLIGDEYQAIYEWNTARPQLFLNKKRDEATWQPKTIAETFRCSPAICSVLSKMTGDGVMLAPSPQGKNQHYREPVRVVPFDKDDDASNVRLAIDEVAKILNECRPHDDNPDDIKTIAVLARGNDDVARLQGYFAEAGVKPVERITWKGPLTKDYLRVVYCLLRNDLNAAMAAYETLLYNAGSYSSKPDMRTALTRSWCGSLAGVVEYRVAMFASLKAVAATLPIGDVLNISDCAVDKGAALRGITPLQMRAIRADCDRFGKAAAAQNRTLASLFAAKDERVSRPHPAYDKVRLVFSTVHGVKGETYDGVVLYTKSKANNCNCADSASAWRKVLGHSLVECETKRIIYVALSRAAQVLTILSPETSIEPWSALTR